MRPCHPCVPLDLFSLLARPLLDMCYRVSLSVANNHTLAIFVYLLASLFHLGDACVICSHKKRKKTLSLSNLSFVVTFSFTHTYSFCTLTHSHVVPSQSPGDLSMTNIHSLLPMSAFSPYVSLDLSPLLVRPLLATC